MTGPVNSIEQQVGGTKGGATNLRRRYLIRVTRKYNLDVAWEKRDKRERGVETRGWGKEQRNKWQ